MTQIRRCPPSGATMIHGTFPAGPARQDTVEEREDVLVFTSEALTGPLTLFGEVRASFFASTSAVHTDFVVRLCRVATDGTSLSLADGIVRASWRHSYVGNGLYAPGHEPSLVEPGASMNTP